MCRTEDPNAKKEEDDNNNCEDEQESSARRRTNSFKVAIVGAGASGLQCAQALLTSKNNELSPNDIVLLEARNRIGGRIYTTTETRPRIRSVAARLDPTDEEKRRSRSSSTNSDDEDEGDTRRLCNFAMDHGAAWVHGTGSNSAKWNTTTNVVEKQPQEGSDDGTAMTISSNPMMELLQQESLSNNDDDRLHNNGENVNVYERHLNPIMSGNGWMRPKTVLHDQQALALFVAGQRIDDSDNNNNNNNNKIIAESLQKHFDRFRRVSDIGQDMLEAGEGMETVHTSLAETIRKLPPKLDEDKHCCRHNGSPSAAQQQEHSEARNDMYIIQALTPFYTHLVECWYGSPAETLPLCEFTRDDKDEMDSDEIYTEEGDFDGPHCTLKRGMQSVLQPLLFSNDVSDCIRLNQSVVQICYNDNNIITLETADHTVVTADCCVVTMPVSCLKQAIDDATTTDDDTRLFFQPPLTKAKQEAIGMTQMGTYKKVFLTFDCIFWPVSPAFVGMVRRLKGDDNNDLDPLGNYLLFDNLWARNGIPCIEAVLFGRAGQWATGRAENEIRDAVLAFMKDAMGVKDDDIAAYCTDCHVTRWEEDPFSRGAYSSLALGATERHVEELSRPEYDGRLIFAGEATISEYQGSVHAALLSGKNAAEKVAARLRTALSSSLQEESVTLQSGT